MIIYSHRGNIYGENSSLENNPFQISSLINSKQNIEIDVWCINKYWFLGHDRPVIEIGLSWLEERRKNILIHCKNAEALHRMNLINEENRGFFHYFWHQKDEYTISSLGIPICYPGVNQIPNSISVMPELSLTLDSFYGIITDWPSLFWKGRKENGS